MIFRLRRRWVSADSVEDVAEALGLSIEETSALAVSLGLPAEPKPKYLPTEAEIRAACVRFRLRGKVDAENRLGGMIG